MYKLIDYYQAVGKSGDATFARGQFWWTCYPKPYKTPEVWRMRRGRPPELMDVRTFDQAQHPLRRHLQ